MPKKSTKKDDTKVPINKKEKKTTEKPREEKTKHVEYYYPPRRDPYQSPSDMLQRFDHEVGNFFEDFERGLFPRPYRRHGAYRMPVVRQPLLDIEDMGKNIKVRAEIPGIPKENIEIKMTETSIEISAKSDREKEEKGRDYYHRERSFHSFYRTIPLPTEVEQTKADASIENGILTITVPKKRPSSTEKVHKVRIK